MTQKNQNKLASNKDQPSEDIVKLIEKVSHDMRTPLSILKSYVELKIEGVDPEIEQFRAAAERSLERLLRIADELDRYSRKDAGDE